MPSEIKRTSPVNFPLQPYQLIHELYVLSDACDRKVLDQFALNNSQFRVFAMLQSREGQRMTLLGEKLMLSKSTITRIVDQLEGRDWVKRIPDPEDRRAQDVILTPQGQEHLEMISAAHRESLVERLISLDPNEQSQLTILLDKLCIGLRTAVGEDNSNGSS